jgi:hypothetical protein
MQRDGDCDAGKEDDMKTTKGFVTLTKDDGLNTDISFSPVTIPIENINYLEHGSGIATLLRLKVGEDFWVKEKPSVVLARMKKARK